MKDRGALAGLGFFGHTVLWPPQHRCGYENRQTPLSKTLETALHTRCQAAPGLSNQNRTGSLGKQVSNIKAQINIKSTAALFLEYYPFVNCRGWLPWQCPTGRKAQTTRPVRGITFEFEIAYLCILKHFRQRKLGRGNLSAYATRTNKKPFAARKEPSGDIVGFSCGLDGSAVRNRFLRY